MTAAVHFQLSTSTSSREQSRRSERRRLSTGRPTKKLDVHEMLQDLQSCHGDVIGLRAGLAGVVSTACASARVASTFVEADGILSIASAAASVPGDQAIQLYALRVLRSMLGSMTEPCVREESDACSGLAISAARRFQNEVVQQAVCETLTAVAKNGGAGEAAGRCAGESISNALVRYPDSKSVLLAALRASCAYVKAGVGLPAQAASALVGAMRYHSGDSTVQLTACRSLLGFIRSPSNVGDAIYFGAFEATLLAVEIHQEHVELQVTAGALLGELVRASAQGEGPKPHLGAGDVGLALLKAWSLHCADVTASAVLQDAFATIAAANPQEAALAVQRSGQPVLWIVAMRLARGVAEVQRLGCEAIAKAAAVSRDEVLPSYLARRLVEAGAVEAIVETMSSGVGAAEASVQRSACEAITLLIAAAGRDCQLPAKSAAGALAAAAAALRRFGVFPWVCIAALSAIAAVLSGDAQERRRAASEAGCEAAARAVLKQHAECVRAAAAAQEVLCLLDIEGFRDPHVPAVFVGVNAVQQALPRPGSARSHRSVRNEPSLAAECRSRLCRRR
eukprot:TRINITY_DN32221_c0_g1_i1.p1 TRINITY_DN32221_c0_g1~~TRINITY_DN32221_c0_g1_i1.p1  ORF type:complete len:590 (+),score=80.67 TRINITY_DN32221_c0_g1_i1:73-1770(+)